MDWFTDLLDTVVLWFLFKPVFHFLSCASKPPVIISTCLDVHEGGASQKMCGLFTPGSLILLWPGLEGWVGPLKFAVSLARICRITFWGDVGMIARAGFIPDCFWNGIEGSWEKTEVEIISSFRGSLIWNWAGLLGSKLTSTDRIIPSLGLDRRITSKASEDFRKTKICLGTNSKVFSSYCHSQTSWKPAGLIFQSFIFKKIYIYFI